jgi:LCP family protein required for cell wall assembly
VSLTSPIRNPDVRDPSVMGRRAWWLIILSVIVPGSAQVVAGNPRLGRWLFGTWLSLVGVAALSGILYLLLPGLLLSFWLSVLGLWVLQALVIVGCLIAAIATVDTFRLVRFVYLPQRTRTAVAIITILGLVIPVGGAAYGSMVIGTSRDTIAGIFGTKPAVEPVDGKYTFMLLGGDAGADRIGLRPDSVSFVAVDATTGQISIVGIPRNLYNAPFVDGSPMRKDWPDGFNCGDNCLFAYIYPWALDHPELYPDAEANGSNPGIEAMRDSVSAIVGMPVQFYVMVDMEGFRQLIDALGGVDIHIKDPINVCVVGQPITYTFQPGDHHFDGRKALMFARTRCDTNDFDRMGRQRQLEEAILREVDAGTVLAKFQDLAAAGKALFQSDLPQSMLGLMVGLGAKARRLDMVRADLVPPAFDYLNPNFSAARKIVKHTVFPPPATPSPTPQQ